MNRRELRKYCESQVLDWRDPNMPVMRDYRFANGEVRTVVDPDYEQRFRQHMLEAGPGDYFRFDPTYNIRRR